MHTVKIYRDSVIDRFSRKHPAAAFCESGDTVIFETRDCYDDNDITEENPLGNKKDAMENPATGPLFVRRAEEGDILRVEIQDIRLRDYAIMRTSPSCGAFHHLYETRSARRFTLTKKEETGKEGFWFDQHLWLDCDAMIGVIGTAPEGEDILSVTPGKHGGNMDCTRIRKGAVLYLPVNVEGALLALGDLHARMGDGEVMICGLETAGEVCVRVDVLKKERGTVKGEAANKVWKCFFQALPLLVEGESVCSIQSAPTLDEAAVLAAGRMEAFFAAAAQMDDVKAGMLMSLLADLVVCQIVDPWKTVRCELPLTVLEAYGIKPAAWRL